MSVHDIAPLLLDEPHRCQSCDRYTPYVYCVACVAKFEKENAR